MQIKNIPFVTALAVALLLGAVACKGGGGDDSARQISEEDLAQMVLALAGFGPDFAGFQADAENGVVTAQAKAEDDFDPEQEARDLARFGWTSGHEADYSDFQAFEEESGLFVAGSSVDLFDTAEGAAGYFADFVAELEALQGTTDEDGTVDRAEPFEAKVADEAVGAHILFSFGGDSDSSIWIGGLFFRHGRLMGSVFVGSFEERRFDDTLKDLARHLDERIATVLAGNAAKSDDSGGDVVSRDPLEVLAASARSFQEEVQSVQAEMDFRVEAGGFGIDAHADMAFRAPSDMYMTMDLGGLGSFEMLFVGGEIYMNIPPEGWVVFSLDDLGLEGLGFDAGTFEDLLSDHSFLDYEALVESLGGEVQDLGDETVDGMMYRHYRATLDFADLAAAFSDALGATGDLGLSDIDGPLTFDVWVSPDDFLPYRLVVNGEFAFGGESMVFDATMRFFDYNQPVEIPSPPPDAVPFTLLAVP